MIDTIIRKGCLHRTFSEDYSIAETIMFLGEQIPFIVVSDGCSGGSHTEIGSQLMCNAARQAFRTHLFRCDEESVPDPKAIFNSILKLAGEVATLLDIPWQTMIATLRVVYVMRSVIYTISAGDGYTFGKTSQDESWYQKYEYEVNAPFYPAYLIFNRQQEYADSFPNNNLVIYNFPQGRYDRIPMNTITYDQYPVENFKYFGVASDGLSSYRRGEVVISDEGLLRNLLDIKNDNGEFLVRRYQKIDKELRGLGADNFDDIGIAIISCEAYKRMNQ